MFINYTAQGERKFIRVMDAGERGIWFCPVAAAYSIGYRRPYEPVHNLISAKNLTVDYFLNGTKRDDSNPDMELVCNKAGLCELLNKSNMPEALEFGEWIDTVVYPDTVRRHKNGNSKD